VKLLKQMTSKNILSGAKEIVLELKRRGIKTAIASVSKNTRTVLQGTGIDNLFDVIVDGYSVKSTKPAPDIFLFAAKELGVEPEDCVVIEDAEANHQNDDCSRGTTALTNYKLIQYHINIFLDK